MFCPKCGTKALDGAGFCQKCGEKLIVEEPTAQPAVPNPANPAQPVSKPSAAVPKKKKPKKLLIILGAVFALIVILIAANADNLAKKGEQAAKDEEYINSRQQSSSQQQSSEVKADFDVKTDVDDTAGQLLYERVPVDTMMDMTAEGIIAAFGEPDIHEPDVYYDGDRIEYVSDEVCFIMSGDGSVFCLDAPAEKFTLNGQSLNLYFEDLVGILGDDYYSLGGSGYRWSIGDLSYTFYISTDDYIADIIEVSKIDTDEPIDNDAYLGDNYPTLDNDLCGRWRSYDGSALTLESSGYATTVFQFWNELLNKPDNITWEASNGRLTLHAHSQEGYYWIISEDMYFDIETDRLYLNRITSYRTPYSTIPGEYCDVSYSRKRTSTTDLAGAWDVTHDRALTLNSDGTGQLGNLPMTWEATESELYFYPVESRTYDYTVSGDTLTIFFNDGAKVYTRVGN